MSNERVCGFWRCSVLTLYPLDPLVGRLLPSHNADVIDRTAAWSDWLHAGGAAAVEKFIRWANGTSVEDDEILQETLIVAYKKVERGAYEHRDLPFSAFLKKIAWYKIMEASRRGGQHLSLDVIHEDIIAEEHCGHERVERWKEVEMLRSALGELPPRRSRIVLLYENGYSTAEIASALGIREALVRKEKSLGLRQLRRCICIEKAG
jgi:RNA polymerase sigma factor (sigma-70 family)